MMVSVEQLVLEFIVFEQWENVFFDFFKVLFFLRNELGYQLEFFNGVIKCDDDCCVECL